MSSSEKNIELGSLEFENIREDLRAARNEIDNWDHLKLRK